MSDTLVHLSTKPLLRSFMDPEVSVIDNGLNRGLCFQRVNSFFTVVELRVPASCWGVSWRLPLGPSGHSLFLPSELLQHGRSSQQRESLGRVD